MDGVNTLNLPRRAADRTGKRHGLLTAVRPVERDKHSNIKWLYKCECGGSKVLHESSASVTGHCGCLTKERYAARIKHGYAHTKGYKAWHAMIARCENPGDQAYKYYGGRGISVCERWKKAYANFLEDMGERPEGLTIERVDVNGNYEPSNCVWATRKQQQRNRRVCHTIIVGGKRLTVTEWGENLGISRNTLFARLRRGWGESETVSTPRLNQGRKDLFKSK